MFFVYFFYFPEDWRGWGEQERSFSAGLGRFASALCPKKAGKKVTNLKKQTKNGAKRLYFNIFVNFLQYFDHFIVEIFPGLDYNKTRKSEEGPKC